MFFYMSNRVEMKHNLLLLDWFENFDDAPFVVCYIYTFKDLTVFSPSHFSNNLIVILITE